MPDHQHRFNMGCPAAYAESNVVVLEGHDVAPETREMFRADLPEFNPELVEEEVRRQFQPRTGEAEGVAA